MVDWYASEVVDPAEYLPALATSAPSAAPAVAGLDKAVQQLIDYIQSRGLVFEPWQIAAFITATRTTPFVILAGISGTGKTRLPRLIAEATGARFHVEPVRPDWTDSSDVLGLWRLDGTFVPGNFLRVARDAMQDPNSEHFFLFDEMNIARVEYYLAEVLSRIEDRTRDETSGLLRSDRLMPEGPSSTDGPSWSDVIIPHNLCVVGTVNMDETTHGFSRKVLDRSFVLEFSDIDLTDLGSTESEGAATNWPPERWLQRYLTLAESPDTGSEVVVRAISTLSAVNKRLLRAQLQVGYRVRDEVSLFCLNALECKESFARSSGEPIDPLDLVISMKVLPRIQGGSQAVRTVLTDLQERASGRSGDESEMDIGLFPLCAARIDLMIQRFDDEGFTSYWL